MFAIADKSKMKLVGLSVGRDRHDCVAQIGWWMPDLRNTSNEGGNMAKMVIFIEETAFKRYVSPTNWWIREPWVSVTVLEA